MATSLIERLPRLVAQGRRQAQRLTDATHGRNRERAVPVECVQALDAPVDDTAAPARRLLRGPHAACVAALLAEQREGARLAIARVILDLHAANDHDPLAQRLARWTPCLALLRTLAPDAEWILQVAAGDRAVVQLVCELFHGDAPVSAPSSRAATATLLLADDPARIVGFAQSDTRWIACVPDAKACADLRRTLLLRGDTTLRIDDVGASPLEWTRRHAAAQPVAAMRAALQAFGATALAAPTMCTTPAGRRRAGGDVLLGETVRDGVRTLVWVDAPDRRTGESTLSRALTRSAHGHFERVIVLGWHFAPTLLQHLAVRGDAQLEVRRIRCLPRGERVRALRIDPQGFAPLEGLAQAWVDRERSRGAPDVEWLSVQLGEDRGAAVVDWAVDPAHEGAAFRGAWHALRDAHAGVRHVRLRLPWQPGPRRVCVRALDAEGRASELLFVVPAAVPVDDNARTHALPARAPACAEVEALC